MSNERPIPVLTGEQITLALRQQAKQLEDLKDRIHDFERRLQGLAGTPAENVQQFAEAYRQLDERVKALEE
jgi:uncharacterized membrane-anchored protein YhcB (DUF1043 family)